ncbi:MAG: YndJ family transporter [Planctomycetota bacterium]|nr:YndJ family transporter [Planctomycetota bacterium]
MKNSGNTVWYRPASAVLAGVAVLVATSVHSFLLPEMIFLGGLLIWLPLALHLSAKDRFRSVRHAPSLVDEILRTAFWPCVAAAAASTFVPRGSISGMIAAGWCGWTTTAAVVSMTRLVRTSTRSLTQVMETVSSNYLVVSSIWFACWRSRVNPLDFPDGITLLTSVHFLYAGSLLPTVSIGLLPDSLAIRHRGMLLGMAVLMPVVAVGITSSPTVEIIGVLLAVLVVLLFCAELVVMSNSRQRSRTSRLLLALASASGVFAIGLAAYYGLSEYTRNTWILIPTMIRWHGVLNSVGLIGGSILAWAFTSSGEARSALP